MTTDEAKINPKAKDFEIGVRNFKTITIWPLSVAGQLQMNDLLVEGFAIYHATKESEGEDYALYVTITNAIKNNLAKVLDVATCGDHKGEELLHEIDNPTMLDIVDTIFEVNYADALTRVPKLIKNVKAVFPKLVAEMQPKEPEAPLSHLKEPQVTSVSNIQATP